ncbi:MAG: hypothetical protein A2Z11_00775 [Candidatus Woykebacteria bacterium RBG_16_43_9]|uniref:Peptidase M60 domain-containing protein n=1 Tax=Candidatus Woykebacteria bacterium RBG_16_43_9 TaxID=1802596 RepID=A0A1G1WCM3_9BACT|nr:MAG: hypothetical protein A2Z11_00775 [Candidatus Woykebacteria bacterium RBG_16_43_9]
MFKIRRFINPPYTIKEIFIALSTLIMLLSAPLVVINIAQERQVSVVAAVTLITNPGFEDGSGQMPSGWMTNSVDRTTLFQWITGSSDSQFVHSGMASAKIAATARTHARWWQDVPVTPFRAYWVKGWIKTENVTVAPGEWQQDAGANLSVGTGPVNRTNGILGTQDWQFKTMLAYATGSTLRVEAGLGWYWGLTIGTAYFDDLVVEPYDAPSGRHVVLALPPEDLAILGDPQPWIQKLDDAYDAMQGLVGQVPYEGAPIGYLATSPWCGCGMGAGNPIIWPQPYIAGALPAVVSNNDLSFGPIHEMGHNFHSMDWKKYYLSGGPINGEHWANFYLTYVADALSAKYPTATFYQGAVGYVPIGQFPQKFYVEQHALPWINAGRTDWENMHNDVYTGLLYRLKNQIGWEPFRQTFRDYATLTGPPPATDLGKVELFAHLLSANAGVDVTPYFQSWGFPIAPAPDIVAPFVSIVSPSAGSTVFGTVSIQANATDNVGVTKVEFYVDGELKETDTSPPYSYSWDTTTVSNGIYSLLAKAYDAANNIGTSETVSVTVNNGGGPSPPTANIKANGSNGPITIAYNTVATLTWTSTNATACSASGGWSGSKTTSGSASTGSLTSNKTYTLTCTGAGGSATDRVTVNIGKMGDLNLDTLANILDLSILLSKWGTSYRTADLNGDGRVNIRDLSILLSRWGR